MNLGINENDINEFGRFDDLKDTVDKNKVWSLCALPLPFEEGDGSPVRACLFSNKE